MGGGWGRRSEKPELRLIFTAFPGSPGARSGMFQGERGLSECSVEVTLAGVPR